MRTLFAAISLSLLLSACTEARLIGLLDRAPVQTGAVVPAFGIYAGGGNATGPGMKLQGTVGELTYPHVATGPGMQLRSGIKSIH